MRHRQQFPQRGARKFPYNPAPLQASHSDSLRGDCHRPQGRGNRPIEGSKPRARFRQDASKAAAARLATEHAHDGLNKTEEPDTAPELDLNVAPVAGKHVDPGRNEIRIAEYAAVDSGEQIRLLIGGATQHDAVDMRKMEARGFEVANAAIDDDRELGVVALEAIDAVIVEWRDFAVLPRRQALQPCLSGVDDERPTAGGGDALDEAGPGRRFRGGT
jgi:hypothetical protein